MAKKPRGEIRETLGGKERTLCLPIGRLLELEDLLGMGVLPLAEKMQRGDCGYREFVTLLHQGVLGGGGEATFEEVGEWVADLGLWAVTPTCIKLLNRAIVGPGGTGEAERDTPEGEAGAPPASA